MMDKEKQKKELTRRSEQEKREQKNHCRKKKNHRITWIVSMCKINKHFRLSVWLKQTWDMGKEIAPVLFCFVFLPLKIEEHPKYM